MRVDYWKIEAHAEDKRDDLGMYIGKHPPNAYTLELRAELSPDEYKKLRSELRKHPEIVRALERAR